MAEETTKKSTTKSTTAKKSTGTTTKKSATPKKTVSKKQEREKKMALVLAGGGGKGAYQAGVIKALRELNLLDDVTGIAGTSIGAVNAMLYAMDDADILYNAWDDINLRTVFDIDLSMIKDINFHFSREEMLKLVGKYIDFDKIKQDKYDLYASICKLDLPNQKTIAEYRRLADYDIDTIKKILLASTALPLIYEPVEIDGNLYQDGGVTDNEPIQPLYDAGYRNFIVIGLNHSAIFNQVKWPDANFIVIYPSRDLGNLIDGTLNFDERAINFRRELGYRDGKRALKTKFEKDDMYIRLEPMLAENDFNEIRMQLHTTVTMDTLNSRISSNMDKFNEIAKKYDMY